MWSCDRSLSSSVAGRPLPQLRGRQRRTPHPRSKPGAARHLTQLLTAASVAATGCGPQRLQDHLEREAADFSNRVSPAANSCVRRSANTAFLGVTRTRGRLDPPDRGPVARRADSNRPGSAPAPRTSSSFRTSYSDSHTAQHASSCREARGSALATPSHTRAEVDFPLRPT